MPDSNSVVGRMYNRTKRPSLPQPQPKPLETAAEREKRAVKVLGGMKVHGTHVKQLEVGDQLIDVPTAAYVKLLEEQIKEVRNQQRELLASHNKLVRKHDRLINELRKVKDELDNKVNLR